MADILKTLQDKPGFVSMAGATDEQIQEAEAQLGLTFAKDYRAYVKAFGAAAFEGHELTGLSKSSRLSVVNATLEERAKNPAVPPDWYVVEQLQIDDVSIWQSGTGEIYQVIPGSEPAKVFNFMLEYIESTH